VPVTAGVPVPPEALIAAVRRLGPAVVVLWAQSRSSANRPPARHVADAQWGVRGARRGPSVLTAGPGRLGHPEEGTLRPVSLRAALYPEPSLPGRVPGCPD
jgi:hypothetical protein